MAPTMAPATIDVHIPHLEQLCIAGEWVNSQGSEKIDVVMPSTEEVIATVPGPTPADADVAVAAAREAYAEGPWPTMSPEERAEVCRRFANELESRMDDLNRAWQFESGYTKAHGEMINSGAATAIWDHAIRTAPNLTWEETRSNATSEVLLERN